ncbi:proton-coupled folate transporter [Drosophila willistoni]|uniref:proton-coupled folate transporter n=1 Tax=Drosophila willistoni TaxID=7260 RepID=UPI001F0764D3|nr:proton-coupled folate transporter [Drosophila willistoni]
MAKDEDSGVNLDDLKTVQWHRLFHMFYIEPVTCILLFAFTLTDTIMRNQVIYQTCVVIFEYNETQCRLLEESNVSAEIKNIETEVQSYVANMFLARTLFENIVPAIYGLFVGSWSDHYGRKPLLIVSMIGFSSYSFLTAVTCGISSSYRVNPWWYNLAVVPKPLLGGLCAFWVAGFCVISDTTDTKTRPYRMIMLEVAKFIGQSSGSLASSYVYAATSAAIIQGISCFITIMATLFIVFYLPETLNMSLEPVEMNKHEEFEEAIQLHLKIVPPSNEEGAEPLKSRESLPEKQSIEEQIETNSEHINLFSLIHVRDMFTTCMQERDYNARAIIWLITLSGFLSIFVLDGSMPIMYLFIRQKFHWSVREITLYETAREFVPMVGAVFGFLILRKIFGLSLVTLTLMSIFSEILSNVSRGLAHFSWHLYLSLCLGVFRSIQFPMCRTIVSYIVPSSDMGKVFSMGNVLQSFSPVVAAPLYTALYKSTLSTNPGMFNFLNASLYIVAFVFICFVMHIKYTHRSHYANLLK